MKPTPTGGYGGNGNGDRGPDGRFRPGNKAARGNPHAVAVARLRSALLSAVTVADITEIVRVLVARARQGDVVAIKELLNRVLGPPVEHDLIQRIERLERIFTETVEAERHEA